MTGLCQSPVTLGELLHTRARDRGNHPFVVSTEGGTWTYAETLDRVRAVAAGLAAMGVRHGDHVATWLPNGPDMVAAWMGINYLGAVHVPLNLAWRGDTLRAALCLADPRVAIVHADLLARLEDVAPLPVTEVVVAGNCPASSAHVRLTPFAALSGPHPPVDLSPVQPWDPMNLLFTSGTTGPSKAVIGTYAQAAAFLAPPDTGALGPEARFMLVLPLFHAGGIASVFAMLRSGGTMVIPPHFSTAGFWDQVRRHGVTSTTLVEQMAAFLLGQPNDADDRRHGLRHVNIAPMGASAYAFAERFGASLWSSYGSTEIGAPIAASAAPDLPGLTGRLRPGYEARVVDAHDMEMPHGAKGELVVRADDPWVITPGYHRNADATAAAWRNGWFHTGDMFRRDDRGQYFFCDRLKDAIRRRGENIASHEVEAALLRHPDVAEATAYAVPADISEDEIMVCLVLRAEIAWHQLASALAEAMPHFMVPRYFRAVGALPRTQNGKVRKDVLRMDGVTADSWDREAHGMILKAERIGAGA